MYMCQLDMKPNLVFVHESPDSSRNLTGKQNYQAGKELLERNKKGCVLHMGKSLFSVQCKIPNLLFS